MASRTDLGAETDIRDKTEEIKISPIIVIDGPTSMARTDNTAVQLLYFEISPYESHISVLIYIAPCSV